MPIFNQRNSKLNQERKSEPDYSFSLIAHFTLWSCNSFNIVDGINPSQEQIYLEYLISDSDSLEVIILQTLGMVDFLGNGFHYIFLKEKLLMRN